MTTPVPFGAGECALDRPERTDWGYHLDHLEEDADLYAGVMGALEGMLHSLWS